MPAKVGGDRGAVAGVDAEVIVVDDESTDDAAEVATDVDARVVGDDVQNGWLGSDAAPTRAPTSAPSRTRVTFRAGKMSIWSPRKPLWKRLLFDLDQCFRASRSAFRAHLS